MPSTAGPRDAAIMQPTYLPWLGYFAMMAEAEWFVFLDSVQFERRSWQQRNRIKGPGGVHMLTVPVLSKGAMEQRIDEVMISPDSDHRRRHVETMRHFYGRQPHFAEASALLFPLIERDTARLADYTIEIATGIARALGIRCTFLRSSALAAVGSKAELLAAICRELGATRYVSAPGSADYLAESDDFETSGIDVVYSTFEIVAYRQPHGAFEPYMSVADALFSIGIEGTRNVIEAGRRLTPMPQPEPSVA